MMHWHTRYRYWRPLEAVLVLITLLGTMLLAAFAWADNPRKLAWEDLVPPQIPLVDPLSDVSLAVRFDLGFAAKVIADQEAGRIQLYSPEHMIALSTLDRLRMQGVDADRLVRAVAERDRSIANRKSAINAELDGQEVRIPGYALPLTAADEGVREFLLVPYVGACIHYPPPPPNQVVFARVEEPHRFANRYETVWITGRLTARPAQSALNYVDGAANVETAWTMEVTGIDAFAKDPSAERDLGNFSTLVESPKLKLSRTGTPHDPAAE